MGRDFWEKFTKHCDETGRTVNLEDIKAKEDKQQMPYNKYRNRKSRLAGMEFDSKLEMNRYLFLQDAEQRGVISDLRRQVPFEITPKQECNGETLHSVKYIADFVYRKDGAEVIEDTKGYITDVFRVKRAVLQYFGDKKIRIVKHSTENV